jgi:hypothetical protein
MNAMAKLSKTESGVPSDLAVPPGEYLAEVIGKLGMTKDELATRMAEIREPSSMSVFSSVGSSHPSQSGGLPIGSGLMSGLWSDGCSRTAA